MQVFTRQDVLNKNMPLVALSLLILETKVIVGVLFVICLI